MGNQISAHEREARRANVLRIAGNIALALLALATLAAVVYAFAAPSLPGDGDPFNIGFKL